MVGKANFDANGWQRNPDDDPSKINRRKILRGGLMLAGALLPVGMIGAEQLLKSRKEPNRGKSEDGEFREEVDAERQLVIKDVERGLTDQMTYQKLRIKYNTLVEKSWHLDKKSPAYKEIITKLNAIDFGPYETRKGNLIQRLMVEANPYARTLAKNALALTALATTRVLYREGVKEEEAPRKEFPYWHNCAAGYLELGTKSPEQIQKKFKALFEYAQAKSIEVSNISPEQILYALIDDSFDFSLNPTALRSDLDRHLPDWSRHPATHENRDSYAHYNNLSVLDIFELNRLKAVMTRLRQSGFVRDVFNARDDDVLDIESEHGGLIAMPSVSRGLRVVPATEKESNGEYLLPNEAGFEVFTSATEFHFHALQVAEPPNLQGPSGGDDAFFAPGVVFSSVDADTILAHFYSSRITGEDDEGFPIMKNEVVCLGEIKREM